MNKNHENAIRDYQQALDAELSALHVWLLDADPLDVNRSAYERAHQERKALLGRVGATMEIES